MDTRPPQELAVEPPVPADGLPDDKELVARAQKGDGVAFAALVERHQRQLYRLPPRLTRREAAAGRRNREGRRRAPGGLPPRLPPKGRGGALQRGHRPRAGVVRPRRQEPPAPRPPGAPGEAGRVLRRVAGAESSRGAPHPNAT